MQVLTVDHVAQSLGVLRGLGVHRNTIMYLCVKRAAAQQKTTENVKIDFREFFERFLTIRNAPSDSLNKPYLIPFEASNAKLWLNRNLAGSFAPSSIRPDNPINTVITMNGSGSSVRYTLKPDHSRKAFGNLLNSKKIPVLNLASFLYRDFGFNTDQMDTQKLMEVFQEEFGYLLQGAVTDDFNEIFTYNTESIEKDIFVPFVQS